MDRNITTGRFSSTPWFKEVKNITIGGAGTIGSWVALLLMRSNDHTIEIIDDDKVESHNLAGQFFSISDVGKFKVEAICDHINAFNPDVAHLLYATVDRVTERTELSPVCISGFDNMAARKVMFEKWASMDDREVFIDGRMAVETFEVFFVRKGQEEMYRKTLFDDSTLDDPICSLKSTSHVGAMMGGIVTSMLNNHLTLSKDDDAFRRTPFHFTVHLPTFNFKIQDENHKSTINTERNDAVGAVSTEG